MDEMQVRESGEVIWIKLNEVVSVRGQLFVTYAATQAHADGGLLVTLVVADPRSPAQPALLFETHGMGEPQRFVDWHITLLSYEPDGRIQVEIGR